MQHLLILGSAPLAARASDWPRAWFDHILVINNAWRLRPDWDELIHPWDFPEDRWPAPKPCQRIVTETDFVPVQNALGGFVYAGGTMAFTAGYWAIGAHAPRVIAMFGCDMHYPVEGKTAFYGQARPDPLRDDITLQSLEAKSARMMILAAMRDIAMVNLSDGRSRLILPRAQPRNLAQARPFAFDHIAAEEALAMEATLGYEVPSGRYWQEADRFDGAKLRELDLLWLSAATPPRRARREIG